MKIKNLFLAALIVFHTSGSFAQLEQLLNKPIGKKKKETTETAPAPEQKKLTVYEKVLKDTDPYQARMKFSNSPIQVTEFSEGGDKTSFAGADRLYCRVYFENSVKDILTDYYRIDLITMIPGDYWSVADFKKQWCNMKSLNPKELENNYLDIPIIPDPRIVDTDHMAVYDCIIGGIKPGLHTYRITLETKKGNFRGEFEFNHTEETINRISADRVTRQELKDKAKEKEGLEEFKAEAANNIIPEQYYTSKGSFKDPKLSIANIKVGLMKDVTNIAQILRVSIEDGTGDWKIVWDKSVYPNIPEHQITTRAIYAIFKGKDGYCYYMYAHGKRDYISGDNSYGDVYLYRSSPRPINCDRVKLPVK